MKFQVNTLTANIIYWGGIILFMAVIITVSYFTTYFEGVASAGFLITAILFLWKKGGDYSLRNLRPLLPILSFAVLGAIFDGAGNTVYNRPIQYLFCPAETSLVRDVKTYENSEGDDVAYHEFSCRSRTEAKIVKEISAYFTTSIRFIEYVFIGFVLFVIYWLVSKLFRKRI